MRREPRRALIIKPSALGDIIHTLPFLYALKARYPGCLVDWVVARGLDGFLEGHPMLGRLWVIDKSEWRRLGRGAETVREIKALYSGLRAERYDLAVDLQGLLRSGLIATATGARVRLGFSDAREGAPMFYTDKVRGGRDIHAIDRYMKLAAYLGCDASRIEYPMAPLGDLPDGLSACLPQGGYVVIAPGAGKEANRWPAPRYGELASILPLPSVVIGGPGDVGIGEAVVEASRGRAVTMAGLTSIKQMALIVRGASAIICNDTGPMHVAAAFGVPVFAIFGPANPVRTGPYGPGHTVISHGAGCAPCYRKRPCRDRVCLDGLGVDRVAGKVVPRLEAIRRELEDAKR